MSRKIKYGSRLISALKNKGWFLYAGNDNLSNLVEIAGFGPVSDLRDYNLNRIYYHLFPKVNNQKSALDIVLKLDELEERNIYPRIRGDECDIPIAAMAFIGKNVVIIQPVEEYRKQNNYKFPYDIIIPAIEERFEPDLNKVICLE